MKGIFTSLKATKVFKKVNSILPF